MARSLTQREDWTRDSGGCLTAKWCSLSLQQGQPAEDLKRQSQSFLLHRIAAIGLDSVVEPGQIKATRGPGTATDYALFVLLLSPEGLRTVFIADWLANEDHVKKGFHYVTHRLGHKQGYVLADLVDPAILVKSQGIAFLDRLFAPIEAWLDGGQEPMPSMSNDLL